MSEETNPSAAPSATVLGARLAEAEQRAYVATMRVGEIADTTDDDAVGAVGLQLTERVVPRQ